MNHPGDRSFSENSGKTALTVKESFKGPRKFFGGCICPWPLPFLESAPFYVNK
jgi:hypothetical protein